MCRLNGTADRRVTQRTRSNPGGAIAEFDDVRRLTGKRHTDSFCPGVEQGIEELSVFEDLVLEASFEGGAGHFQQACGRRIVRKDLRRDATERKVVETEISDRRSGQNHR